MHCRAYKKPHNVLIIMNLRAVLFAVVSMMLFIAPNLNYLISPRLTNVVAFDAKDDINAKDAFNAKDYDVIIVGSGLSGAVLAERHASRGEKVLVLERRNHIGGNCYDYTDEATGIRVSKYGAHLFHTEDEEVWDYLQRFAKWLPWEHKVMAWVNETYVPVPVNIQTVNTLFGMNIQTEREMQAWLRSEQTQYDEPKNSKEMALSRVGARLYNLMFGPYTRKQWNTSAENLGPEVTGRIPVRDSFDNRYFSDKYQALPAEGYTKLFERMLHLHQPKPRQIHILLNTDFFSIRDQLKDCKLLYYTGPIDQYFGTEERLEYRSLVFKPRYHMMHGPGFVLPASVVNYPSLEFPFTRVIEYKQMLNQTSVHSVLFEEYPSDTGEPYYPVPSPRNQAMYAKLLEKTHNLTDARLGWATEVHFVGRLANYKYLNMDQAVGNALDVFARRSDLHVVTSVYNEDPTQWFTELCDLLPGIRVSWFIYSKSPRSTDVKLHGRKCVTVSVVVTHLPNVGREGHSWLTHMLRGDHARTCNVFLQGHPEVNMKRVASWVLRKQVAEAAKDHFHAFHRSSCTPTEYFDLPQFHVELNTLVQAIGVDKSRVCASYKGEFAAGGFRLARFLRTWKHLILETLMPALEHENDPMMGHALERCWRVLFQKC